MKKSLFTLLLAAACFTASAQTVSDLDLVYDSDSTRFLVASTPMTWNDAQAYAESLGGHLATFSDAAENVHVAALLPPAPNEGYWIGLVQEASGTEPNDGWHWISGETLSFTFWSNEEPSDDANTDADCGECDEGSGGWNDVPCSFFRRFVLEVSNEGCTDNGSCNYNALAIVDDGNCHYDCQFCLEGTVWSEVLGGCVVANVSDTDFDGCVGITDFLVHLSNFGSGCGPEPAWACGDPLEYQGYNYETVQIGDQCWFAENLRAENYRNGEEIFNLQSDEYWSSTPSGAQCAFDNVESFVDEKGRLYNGYAVLDDRRLCPVQWHVPSEEDFESLELFAGVPFEEIWESGFRGTTQGAGQKLKSQSGWCCGGNGFDEFGFKGSPAGLRRPSGTFDSADSHFYFWGSSVASSNALWRRELHFQNWGVYRSAEWFGYGMSVRCIKDSE